MMPIPGIAVWLVSLATVFTGAEERVRLEGGGLRLEIDRSGRVRSLSDTTRGREYLAPGQTEPLLSLVVAGKVLSPSGLAYDLARKQMWLNYGTRLASAKIRVATRPTHVTLELIAVEGVVPERVDWGPLPTTIGKSIGETVGVVRDDRFALGIQALNVQTIGLAAPRPFGSVVAAYAIQHDGGVRGSKIALFGCPEQQALATLGRIELAEGLPHPMLDGVWGKISPTAKRSYLIAPFGEPTIDEVCQYARRAGLTYVYHPGPFATWGHFVLNRQEFPDGDTSMAGCVARAGKHGIRLGVHTLTGFITTNDAYVTPVPDPRLARSGSSTLTAAVDAVAGEIPIADPEPFRRRIPWDKPMNTVILGRELVQYQAVSRQSPWRLTGCKRGAFGTRAGAHAAGHEVGRLADHAYSTFYPGIDNGMMDEMTRRLVELLNATGLRQISFDGLEGLSAYGYGEYSRNRFVKQCYDGWKPEVISDASNLLHYLWHVHTRMNWGEPWGKAMREGMAEYRFHNQAYFERNLFPRMLGWFELRCASPDFEATTPDDMEWMLAKAAGYDAGFAIATSLESLKANAQTPAILQAVREWEAAQLAGTLSARYRAALRGPGEFHLDRATNGSLRLQPVAFSPTLSCAPAKARAGEAQWIVENKFVAQPVRFVLRVVSAAKGGDARVVHPSLEIAGRRSTFPVELRPQQYLVCRGEQEASVCDANWKELRKTRADAELPPLSAGKTAIRLRFTVLGDPPPEVQLRFQVCGEYQAVPEFPLESWP
jgi:hypothetical protein